MEAPKAWRAVWYTVWVCVLFPWTVRSDPIIIDFTPCRNATYVSIFPNITIPPFQCCPLLPTRPIIDGLPPPTTSTPRVRPAAQCTDQAYADKLNLGYQLMRALPDDDPRSFKHQWQVHCAYCGGAFLTYNSSGDANGIDIHFSWLFLPWHRLYMYFQERILQTLLGDPTFSLNYWNWDLPFTVGDGNPKDGSCHLKGDNFPSIYADPTKATYDSNRSANAKGHGRLDYPGFTFSPIANALAQPLANATEDVVIQTNLNVMYNTLVGSGTNAETFMGREYRKGDLKGFAGPTGGAGTMEEGPHPAVHFWTGVDPPSDIDMGALQVAARDPVFFGHHGNIDRMWVIWNEIGPLLGADHSDYDDPDFLEASFLFYDENKDLRRVKVKESLDISRLGYVYQGAPIEQWLYLNRTSCSKLSYNQTIAAAATLPVPVKNRKGKYDLASNATFNIVILRPNNTHGLEEFLVIDGITLDRSLNGGFDVFVDLLAPSSYENPWGCPEYPGSFANMANLNHNPAHQRLVWKHSITQTFVDIDAPDGPSKTLITLVSTYPGTIYFTNVTIVLGT